MTLVIRPLSNFVDDIVDLVTHPSALESTQCKFLAKYLTEVGAASFVVEDNYTDAGYLVDYASYYARCHSEFGRCTKRLHFFRSTQQQTREYMERQLDGGLDAKDAAALQEAYLGFVVLKPLPETIIGRTCVVTYADIDAPNGRLRHYPIERTYDVNLYGIALEVRTIAFQEQDNEVAACSTTAIWYTLHGLPKKLTTQEIQSPFEITNAGSATYVRRNLGEVTRKFPTSGLSLEQVEAHLRSHGMECIVCGVTPTDTSRQVKEYVAAYVRGGYPMIVVGNLYASAHETHGFRKLGLHAVTALGYSYDPAFAEGDWAARIVRLYAHDDNVGPYTSFRFETCEQGGFARCLRATAPQPAGAASAAGSDDDAATHSVATLLAKAESGLADLPEVEHKQESRLVSYLSNVSGNEEVGRVYRRLVPAYFVIPVNPKVRFPYETVHLAADRMHGIWRDDARLRYPPGHAPAIVSWTVELLEVSSYKAALAARRDIDRAHVRAVLLESAPKYLWRLQFTELREGVEAPLVDFIFDATDLRQSGGVICVTPYRTPTALTFIAVLLAWIDRHGRQPAGRIDSETESMLRRIARWFLDVEAASAGQASPAGAAPPPKSALQTA